MQHSHPPTLGHPVLDQDQMGEVEGHLVSMVFLHWLGAVVLLVSLLHLREVVAHHVSLVLLMEAGVHHASKQALVQFREGFVKVLLEQEGGCTWVAGFELFRLKTVWECQGALEQVFPPLDQSWMLLSELSLLQFWHQDQRVQVPLVVFFES